MVDDIPPPIPDAFDRLSAEHEERWLDQVFLPPPDFDSIARMRSVIVFGDEGSGKTALKMALLRHARSRDQGVPLVLEWLPGVPSGVTEDGFVPFFLCEVLNAAAEMLVQKIGHNPALFVAAPEFRQKQMIWFLHSYLVTEEDLVLLRFGDVFNPDGIEVLKNIFASERSLIIPINSPQPKILAEVTDIFQKLGYSGISVLVDNFDAWLEVEPERLNTILKALFSTLALFDTSGFVIKVMCSEKLKPALISSAGIARRRLDTYQLKWTPDLLMHLTEKRLSHCLSMFGMRLKDLSDDDELISRLKRYGGRSPRGWLEVIRPLVDEYSRQESPHSLNINETKKIYAAYPPQLRIDLQLNQVWVGYSPINDLSASSVRLLKYLYLLPSRNCTKSELYYKVLQELSYIPDVGDSRWESPNDWNGVIDTALWRLRQGIEADPKKPIYIVSQRGKGIVKLENSW